MKKECYEKAEIEIIVFSADDVLLESNMESTDPYELPFVPARPK